MSFAQQLIDSAISVIKQEAFAVKSLLKSCDENFVAACQAILQCRGRVVVSGIGKSGHVGKKIAATFSSTGTASLFMHASEALHGDLGMLVAGDVLVLLSHSGESEELLAIIAYANKFTIPVIILTGSPTARVSVKANIVIHIPVNKEACPLNLAPTSSTTACMAMADAVAVAVYNARGITKEDFALAHPAGSLGRKLLTKVTDIMHKEDQLPVVMQDDNLKTVVLEMSLKKLGIVAVVTKDKQLIGVFTDKDLRRCLYDDINLAATKISSVIAEGGVFILEDKLAVDAATIMRQHKINAIIVINKHQQVVGALNWHDLLAAGVL